MADLSKREEPPCDPCPGCGRTDTTDNAVQESAITAQNFRSPAGGTAWFVGCVCGFRGPSRRLVAEAIAAWNRRSPPPDVEKTRELVEALKSVRVAILDPVNSQSIVCTVWMPGECPETVVDFIDQALAAHAQERE